MPQYDDTNRGVLFKNDKKETEKHPDYTGKIDVEGKPYRLAAWIKESRNGGKFMSVAVSEFNAEQHARTDGRKQGNLADDLDDSIPF